MPQATDETADMKVTAAGLMRARKREVKQVGEVMWRVTGLPDEQSSAYIVRWKKDAQKYRCTCHALQHGGSRARKGCTHELAVRLSKPTLPSRGEVKDEGEGGTAPEPDTSPLELTVQSELWYQGDKRPMPSWLTELRELQVDAVRQVLDHFDDGADVVFLEAPTGTGKTVIGELVRRATGSAYGLYVCSGKELQDQFARDFPYASVVKGRSNYPTLIAKMFPEVTAADCNKEQTDDGYECTWCGDAVNQCPYEVAKRNALGNPLAALNSTYALYEWNFVGKMATREVVIMDEADLLESEVMGFVEFSVGERTLKSLGVEAPGKSVHYSTIEKWLKEELLPAATAEWKRLKGRTDITEMKRGKTMANVMQDIVRILNVGIAEKGEDGEKGWVRVYEERDPKETPKSIVLKPVKVDEASTRVLWPNGKKWLLMSATLVSVDEMVDSLGLRDAEFAEVDEKTGVVERHPARWESVHVPAVFPIEHRPIVVAPVADVSRRGQQDGGLDDLMDGLEVVLRGHLAAGHNILVHTHTYAIANEAYRRYGRDSSVLQGQRAWNYTTAHERARTLQGFKDHGGVLFAPSMDRGVDLPGNLCRVQVICKLPLPYIGDAQISARLKTRGGEQWYATQAARGLIQMTGRGVRSMDDWCVTYVLDMNFGKWRKRNKNLIPDWWSDSVEYVRGRDLEDTVTKFSTTNQATGDTAT